MTVPGVGVIVALTYRTGVDAPERFSKSRDVGAHFGLTPKRYSSRQTDYDGASVVAVTRWSAQPSIKQRTFRCIMADGHRSDPGPCGSRREAA
jgi:Transposase IS116/IS110/IS902 family